MAKEALEPGDGGLGIDDGVLPGVVADEDGAVVGNGDPGWDAELEHGLGFAGPIIAGDAGVGIAQVDGDDSPRRVIRRRIGRPLQVEEQRTCLAERCKCQEP